MRIDKYLSNLKYGSRKEVHKYIKKGLIKVNDKIITKANYRINLDEDLIYFNNELIKYYKDLIIALNKPVGYLSANKDNLHKVALSLVKEPFNRYDLKIAGRLDLNTSGLLILTTNGSLVHRLTSPNMEVEKEYLVKVDSISNNYKELLKGVNILDGKNNTYKALAKSITKIDDYTYKIVITEGKFHQVRRMFKHLNLNVIKLKRIRYGKLNLNDLKEGSYKLIEENQLIDKVIN